MQPLHEISTDESPQLMHAPDCQIGRIFVPRLLHPFSLGENTVPEELLALGNVLMLSFGDVEIGECTRGRNG